MDAWEQAMTVVKYSKIAILIEIATIFDQLWSSFIFLTWSGPKRPAAEIGEGHFSEYIAYLDLFGCVVRRKFVDKKTSVFFQANFRGSFGLPMASEAKSDLKKSLPTTPPYHLLGWLLWPYWPFSTRLWEKKKRTYSSVLKASGKNLQCVQKFVTKVMYPFSQPNVDRS